MILSVVIVLYPPITVFTHHSVGHFEDCVVLLDMPKKLNVNRTKKANHDSVAS